MRAEPGLTRRRLCGQRGASCRPSCRVSRVFQTFAAASFQSIWYWVLHVVVWTLACYRTLGVPHDLLLRARRVPEVSARVDTLAQLTSERVGGIYDALGVPIAAGLGFLLAGLFALGFGTGIETAQAAFAIVLPLVVINYSKLRLALAVRRHGIAGPRLVLALARRRVWHQLIAVVAILGAAGVALSLHPRIPMP
jgi:hypothetical protein